MNRRAACVPAALGTLGIGSVLAAGGAGMGSGYLGALPGGGYPVAVFLVAAPAGAVAALLCDQRPQARIVLVLAAVAVVDVLVAEAMLVVNTCFVRAPFTGAWSVPSGVVAVAVISAVIWFIAGTGGRDDAVTGTTWEPR